MSPHLNDWNDFLRIATTKKTVRGIMYKILFILERGSMLSTAIFVYAATAPINGYFGGSLYAR